MHFQKKLFIIALLILTVGFCLKFLADTNSQNTKRALPIDQTKWDEPGFIDLETKYWEESIKKYGAPEAYVRFKQDYAKSPAQTQHPAAHLMGKALYKALGIEAITICDSSFSFGCFHSSIGQALSHEGIEIVDKIDQLCLEKYGEYGIGCAHGIGHGLGEWFGPENLERQLEVCRTLKWQKNLLGCSGGVFMEYNFPTTISQTGSMRSSPKEMVELHEPCNKISLYQESCYFELPNWWEIVLDKNYQLMGEECQKISNPSMKESCLIGIGSTLAPSNQYNAKNIANSCISLVEEDAQNLCFAGAAWMTYATPEHKDEWKNICQYAPNPTVCMDKADIIEVIDP